MLKLDERILTTFNKRASIYSSKTDWVDDVELLNPLVPEKFGNGYFLDVCAGTGAVSLLASKKHWIPVSLDINRNMLAERPLPLPIVGPMEELPFIDKFFDIAALRQGIHYAKDIQQVLYEMRRVTKREIRLGTITRAEKDDSSFWTNYFSIASPGRKYIFNPYELGNTAKEMGFNVEYISTIIKMDNYIGPILHLPDVVQKQLIDLLLNTSDEFKQLYHVTKTDYCEYTYSNRWEFLRLTW